MPASRGSRGDGNSRIRTSLDPAGIHEGDSIAVDGVCLTVIRIEGAVFAADASLETLSLTTLKDKVGDDRVNLERAMRAIRGSEAIWSWAMWTASAALRLSADG